MQTQADIWTQAVDVMNAYVPTYRTQMTAVLEDAGVQGFFFALLQARSAHPEPLTPARFAAQSPYTNPERLQAMLAQAVEAGFLTQDDDGYRLTAVGHSVVERAYATAHEGIPQAPALPAADMQRLSSTFRALLDATLAAAEPADKTALSGSRWTDPGKSAAPAVRLDQFITDLLNFRDDAHVAAWRATGVDGRDWEALTFIWRGEATTAAALADRLPFRGYTADDYAASLHVLEQKGWIAAGDDGYRVTEDGRGVREAAEAETDRLFYAGWSVIEPAELQETGDLLAALKAAVTAAEPAAG